MAASGYTPILIYGSSTATNTPLAANLTNSTGGSELAINVADGKLFYKDSGGTVQVIASKNAAAGIFTGTGAITIPAGTTAQQPTGVQGMLRYNTTSSSFEGYNGTTWGAIGGGGGGGSTFTRTDFTATAGQTVFTVSYTVGNIDVYRNGIKLGIADFTATNGTSITLGSACVVGDLVETLAFNNVAIGTTVSTFSGGSTGLTPATATSGAITLGGTLAIANGGTNSTATPTAGGAVYGTGTAMATTAAGTSGQPLISAGAGAPAFGTLALGVANTNVSGALTATNGGTGVAGTLTGFLYANGTSAATAASTAQVLALIGTLPIANGGTNSTATPTAGGVGYGTGTAYAFTAAGTAGQVLTSNGAAAPTWQAAAGGGIAGIGGQVFTASGTFTIPAGVTLLKVTVVGGGGNGGSSSGSAGSATATSGGGGGAGGVAIKYLTGLTAGNTLTVTRGAAGATSSVASGTQTITTISCTGGAAGPNGAGGGGTGAGGTATGGDINLAGQAGNGGWNTTPYTPGCNYSIGWGGDGGSNLYGRGGFGLGNGAAQGYGSGGSGGWSSSAGTAGAGGIIIFEW